MKIKEILSASITNQLMEDDGCWTEVELVFQTAYGEQKQKIICFQTHEDIQAKKFIVSIREVEGDEQESS